MKKRLKTQKPIAIITSLAMALSLAMVPGGVARADEATSVPEWAVDDGTQGESSKFAELPATLKLREKNLVTPVKQQSPWQTCWAFGATAAAESSILSTMGSTYDKSNLDLSERHLAWFAVHHVTEAEDPAQAGEGCYPMEDGNKALDTGGMNILVTTMYSQGVGPVTEAEFPYRGVGPDGEPRLSSEALKSDPERITRLQIASQYHLAENEVDPWLQGVADKNGITFEEVLKSFTDDYREAYDKSPSYCAFDDWTIPETDANGVSNRFKHAGMIIKDGNVLPEYWDAGRTAVNEASMAAMKQELANGRGVCIGYRADMAQPGAASDSTYMNRTNWAQYTFDNIPMDHAVCLVGWDDNYLASNFTHDVYKMKKDANGNYVMENGSPVIEKDADGNPIIDPDSAEKTTPPGNGAWIVKNSWGSQTDTMQDDRGNLTGNGEYGVRDADGKATGYFYLSYYDMTIQNPETMSFSSSLLGPTGMISIFQHDYMAATGGFYTEPSEGVMSSANVFDLTKENGDQVVVSVGGRTSSENQRATFAIYQLNDGATNPTDGKLLRRASSSFEYAGYHRLDLNEPLPIRAGHKYSIVTTVSSQGENGKQTYSVSANQGVSKPIREWLHTQPGFETKNLVWTQAVVNKGESFLYKDGEWIDWSDYTQTLPVPDDPELKKAEQAGVELNRLTDVLPVDNFSIKMYAEPADIPAAEYRVIEGDGSTWTRGSDADLPFTFKRFDEAETDDTTFSHFASASVDGNAIERDKDYAAAEGSVKVNLKPSYLGALSAGEHTITAAFDDGTATAKFTVAEAPAPETPAADTTPTATTTTPTTGTTSIAKTADPTSFAAIAAAGVAGVTALVIGRRRKR